MYSTVYSSQVQSISKCDYLARLEEIDCEVYLEEQMYKINNKIWFEKENLKTATWHNFRYPLCQQFKGFINS